jgi:hypothetical protein
MRYQKAMTLSLITDRVPPVLCAYYEGNNTGPTQLDNWKAHKDAWSLSKNPEERSKNECFFYVWLVHVSWLVMLILNEGIIKAGNVPWLYISSYYESLVRLYISDDYRTRGPGNYNKHYLFWLLYERQLTERKIVQAGLNRANIPTKGTIDSLDMLGIFWKFQCY